MFRGLKKMKDRFCIRRMTEKEVDGIAVELAAKEGWNPGIHDAACFYAADPRGFFVGELEGDPVATISAVAYDDHFGFLGFYIVKQRFRKHGYGMQLWRAALDYLGSRNMGGDGVLERIVDYETEGFKAYYRNRRYQGMGLGQACFQGLSDIRDIDFERLASYDDGIFPAKRHKFLKCWISRPGTKGYAVSEGGKLAGYGVVRPCYKGYKIGPLFADDSRTAGRIFDALRGEVPPDREVFFDTPEVNPGAVRLAEENQMKVVFETARIYSGGAPSVPLEKIYGVTSFELG